MVRWGAEVYCSVLGAHAVHVAMAGYTGVVVGKVDERYVMLPNHAITKAPPRRRVASPLSVWAHEAGGA